MAENTSFITEFHALNLLWRDQKCQVLENMQLFNVNFECYKKLELTLNSHNKNTLEQSHESRVAAACCQ